jgi:hypothetical protein
MGFFWVSSFTIKHVFVKNPDPEPMTVSCSSIVVFCASEDFDVVSNAIYADLANPFRVEQLTEPPYYITRQYGTNYSIHLLLQCVDCRVLGGEALKPDFWQ